jgi:hypothetical protein
VPNPDSVYGSRQASNEKEYTLWLNALKEAQQGGNGYRRWLDKARVGIGPIRAAVLLNSEDAERTGVRFVPFMRKPLGFLLKGTPSAQAAQRITS